MLFLCSVGEFRPFGEGNPQGGGGKQNADAFCRVTTCDGVVIPLPSEGGTTEWWGGLVSLPSGPTKHICVSWVILGGVYKTKKHPPNGGFHRCLLLKL